MTRRFDRRPIPREVLERVLRAGLRAPSAGFSQGVDFVVLEEDSSRQRFFAAASDESWRAREQERDGVLAAPVLIVPIADPNAYTERYHDLDKASTLLFEREASEWPVPFWVVDASFASMLVLLKATDEGLGALFFQLHGAPGEVLVSLGAPSSSELIGAIALGYPGASSPSTSPARRRRRSFDESVHFERF